MGDTEPADQPALLDHRGARRFQLGAPRVGRLGGSASLAWARVLAGLIAQTGASAVVAAATDRGNEVMAHLGALAGQPMAANCVSAGRAGAGSYRIVRQRWAGLLLEDAVLEAPVALLTVATDAVPATPAAGPATLAVHVYEPELAEGDLLVRASESAGQSGGVSLPSAPGGGGRPAPAGDFPVAEPVWDVAGLRQSCPGQVRPGPPSRAG